MPHTDAAAVALARDGDSEAFKGLVERHSRAVYRLAHRMTGNPQDAEDVVQETFLKAYRQLGRFESRANFGTWLHRIAVNCSIDVIRARKHQETAHDAADLDMRSEEHTSELQSHSFISYAVFCLNKQTNIGAAHTDLMQPPCPLVAGFTSVS